MRKLLIIPTIISASLAYGQARLVINNDAYITMDGGVFIVLENSNTNAITTLGTGANIVSEDEDNKIRWQIGTATGSYTIPWYSQLNAAGMKMPLTFNITSAGVGGTNIDFSTYRTSGAGSGANNPWPSMVTHLLDANTGTVNNELYVVDRFWLMDATTYGTRPDVSLTMFYDGSVDEIASGNLLVEADLVAQRFNTTTNEWGGMPSQQGIYFGNGTLNAGANSIGPFAVTGADLFEAWTLSSINNLLPIELLSMNVICDGMTNVLTWSTATELNNAFFAIERSEDGITFDEIGQVPGAINSSSVKHYSFKDQNAPATTVFYRLRQVDFDEKFSVTDVVAANCVQTGTDLIGQYTDGENVGLQLQSGQDQDVTMQLMDATGKLVMNETIFLRQGYNNLQFNHSLFSKGIYVLGLSTEDMNISRKLFIGR